MTHDPTHDGSIVITPADMYRQTTEQFGSISQTLQHLESKLSPLPAQVAEHDAYLNQLREAGLPGSMVEIRADVKRIDKQQAKWLGMGAGIGFVSAVIGALLPILLR